MICIFIQIKLFTKNVFPEIKKFIHIIKCKWRNCNNVFLNWFLLLDSCFILPGRLYKQYYEPFWNTVRLDEGGCKFELFLVTVVWISEFSANSTILLTTNITREYIYWEVSVSIFNNSLLPAHTIIRTSLFCSLNTLILWVLLPQKIKPYDITEQKKV
jgi:hypothetical protein